MSARSSPGLTLLPKLIMLMMTMMLMMMMMVVMVMVTMCAVLTLLTGPTQRLLLTPDSSCVEPILDQFELTADRDNDDHEDVGNFQKNDKDGELVQLQIQPRCYQIIVMMVLMMIRKMNIMIPINILG